MPAFFKIIESDGAYLESHIGIQYRGGSSQAYPKKSMEIEFCTDAACTDNVDYSLLGLIETDGWNLQAMYNEPLRIRSKTSNDIWRMINTLHYQQQEPEAINGIRMKYVELFVNNEYRGLYCVGEKVNRKQLKLKKHNGNIKGELYKGDIYEAATLFVRAPAYDNNSKFWGGFEYKHPKEEVNWENLHSFVSFVVNANDEDFYANYANYFELDNLVDYFIFLNLMSAADNRGKNLYIAKYTNNDKYFYVPWDLDGTFGNDWQGNRSNNTLDLHFNELYRRAFNDLRRHGFRDKLKNKWLALRNSTITFQSLNTLFNANHQYLKENGIYERENFAWQDYQYAYGDLNYMYNWINGRLAYLDEVFLENFIYSSIETATKEDKIKIYPNPTQGTIYMSTVENLHYDVIILNNLGQIIRQEMVQENQHAIHLGDIPAGIYHLQAKYHEHTEVHRIILTR